MGGGEIDYDKVTELVIREFRSEKMGPITLSRWRKWQSEMKLNNNY